MCDVSIIEKEIFDLLSEQQSEYILGSFLKCKVVNSQKKKFYRYSYDPRNIQKLIGPEYQQKFDVFDFEKKEKCCYCISIALYFKDTIHIVDIYKYLTSILASINNAKNYLPNWVVRLYLDSSVHNILKNTKDKFICNVYNKIYNAENVEIHTYMCQSISLERIRMFRFFPLIDDTVAKCAVREADGYLCKLDCHNISLFEDMPKIFYLPSITTSYAKLENGTISNPYYDFVSNWLKYYKNLETYFQNHQNIYSLLAGLLTSNLKVKKKYFLETYQKINQMNDSEMDEDKATQIKIGFDENFLLDLFKESISVRVKELNMNLNRELLNKNEYEQVSNLIVGYNEYENIFVDCNLGFEICWKELEEGKYLKIPKDFYSKNTKKKVSQQEQFLPWLIPLATEESLQFTKDNLTLLKIVDSYVNMKYPKIFNLYLNGIKVSIFPFTNLWDIEVSLLSLLNFPYENPDIKKMYDDLDQALRAYKNESDFVPTILKIYQEVISELDEYYQ
jgi:hypothetical protein